MLPYTQWPSLLVRSNTATDFLQCLRAFDSLMVPGLAEKRPSVLIGDRIRLRSSESDGAVYMGFVHHVDTNDVFLSLHPGFSSNIPYDVEFLANRTSFLRMHQALDLGHLASRILYPGSDENPLIKSEDLSLVVPTDPRLRQNAAQLQAVSSILTHPPSIPFILFGP